MFSRRRLVWLLGGLGLAAGATGTAWWWFSRGGVKERIAIPMGGRVEKTEAEWRELLTEDQFEVARKKGTERPFANAYWKKKDDGVYVCVCCGQPLFDSEAKYDSGTGWPSYWQPVDESTVSLVSDNRLFMRRTEVVCSRCDAHLGHVFQDGPEPTGLRYCMNSAALKFVRRSDLNTRTGETGSFSAP